ncbi:MAG: enoyl-CoA hydratase [Ilumatobacteraceae bacterium]|nr:enoyl-CoA hydratase [Ilumatobacteraceae bacterium]
MNVYEGYETLEFVREGGVLTIALNRPGNLNMINGPMHTELSRVFFEVAMDRDVNAVVLTGRGRAFSAGGDLDWISGLSPAEFEQCFAEGKRIVQGLLNLPQPIVVAINGHSMGLATTIALLCDVAYAATGSLLGDPHVLVGMVPGDGATLVWPALVGMGRAKYHLMSGAPMASERAAEIGLVVGCLDPAEVLTAATALATKFAQLPPQGIRGTKKVLNSMLSHASSTTIDLALTLEQRSTEAQEHKDAIAAFRAGLRGSRAPETADAHR